MINILDFMKSEDKPVKMDELRNTDISKQRPESGLGIVWDDFLEIDRN